jgi:hypothetical protein
LICAAWTTWRGTVDRARVEELEDRAVEDAVFGVGPIQVVDLDELLVFVEGEQRLRDPERLVDRLRQPPEPRSDPGDEIGVE